MNRLFYLLTLTFSLFINSCTSKNNNQLSRSVASSTLIAYESYESGNSEIYTMKHDGSLVKQLTKNNYNDSWPRWSPDGEKIVTHDTLGKEKINPEKIFQKVKKILI